MSASRIKTYSCLDDLIPKFLWADLSGPNCISLTPCSFAISSDLSFEKLSTKMIGETLEQHCEHEFNKYPYSYIEMSDWSTQSHGPIDMKNWHIFGINFNFKL